MRVPFRFHWLLIALGFLVLAIDGLIRQRWLHRAYAVGGRMGIHKQDLGPVLAQPALGLSLGAHCRPGIGPDGA